MIASWLAWYLCVTALGWAVLPFVTRRFAHLPSRGVTLLRPLGLLVTGFVLWQGTALGWLANEPGGALIAALAVAVVCAAVTRRKGDGWGMPWRRGLALLRGDHRLVWSELVFLAAFAGWAWVRAHDPAVNHTEEPMDLLLLNAISTQASYPPLDPWMAGAPVGYYYFGYWLQATVASLAGTTTGESSYNLAQALWFGLLVSTCFGVGIDLAARRRRLDSTARLGGLLAVLAVACSSNPAGVRHAIEARIDPSPAHWWWWESSRVLKDQALDGTAIPLIDEFPLWSYLLGDNHPHLLAMPFLAIAIHCAIAAHRIRRISAKGVSPPGLGGTASRWALPVLLGATLVATNTWDVVAGLLIALAALAGAPARSVVRSLVILITASFAFAWPHLLTAQSSLRGFLPNLFHPAAGASLLDMFGLLLSGVALVLFLNRPERGDVGRMAILAALIFAGGGAIVVTGIWWGASGTDGSVAMHALQRWSAGWPVAALLCLGAAAFIVRGWRARPDHGLGLAALLAAAGFLLVLAPEVLFVVDVFENRMNTVFKFYYGAWLLLGVASAAGLARGLGSTRPWRLAATGGVLLLTSSLIFAATAIPSKARNLSRPAVGLDALAHVASERPGEHAIARWIRENTAPHHRVLQAPGESYRAEQSWLSVATGRPTLVGWQGHEIQWRGDDYPRLTERRLAAINSIYRAEAGFEATLREWDIDYVAVGPVERSRYDIDEAVLERLRFAMDEAVSTSDATLFRRRGPR